MAVDSGAITSSQVDAAVTALLVPSRGRERECTPEAVLDRETCGSVTRMNDRKWNMRMTKIVRVLERNSRISTRCRRKRIHTATCRQRAAKDSQKECRKNARTKPGDSEWLYVLDRSEDKDKEKDEKDKPELFLSVRND